MKHRLIILLALAFALVPSTAHAAHVCGAVYASGGGATLACTDTPDTFLWNGASNGTESILSVAERPASWQETGGIGTAGTGTSCRHVNNERAGHSIVGIHIVTTKLNRYFCGDGKAVTRHPPASLRCDITDTGSWLGWHGCTVQGRTSYCEYWRSNPCGAHYKEVTWEIHRCIPSPWGCIQISQRQITRWTLVYADMHAVKG